MVRSKKNTVSNDKESSISESDKSFNSYDVEEDEYDEDEDENDDDEDVDDEDVDDEDEDDEDEDVKINMPSGGFFNNNDEKIYIIMKSSNKMMKTSNKIIKKVNYDFYKKYNTQEKKYFDKLTIKQKDDIKLLEDKLIINDDIISVPIRFKILNLNFNERTKRGILTKIDNLNKMSGCTDEYHKLNNWIIALNNIPFNNYYKIPVGINDGIVKICEFLNGVRIKMDETIYAHKEAKEQIIRVLAQLISFPRANGYVIGIQGSAGVGKTKLIKEGICNALNYPNSFISLSGTDDSSFLRGHSYTYEGSTYGKICESLMKTGIMNPLLLFDELDKVSNTSKGQEIINTLIHITDPVQNDKFNDRYLEEIDLDISRSMIIFTYNDEELINPILKDRMIVINVKGYNNEEKIILARDYLIPEILKQYNLNKEDLIFSKELIIHIISNVDKEDGVRNLKRSINNIISWINMMIYVPTDIVKISLPYNISISFYDSYSKKNISSYNNTLHSMYL